MRRNATLQSEATFKIAARRCREGEVQGRAVVQGPAWQLHALLSPLLGITAPGDGREIPVGHAIPLRSNADVALRYDAAAVDIGWGRLRSSERREDSSHSVADGRRPAVHAVGISAGGTRDDVVRNRSRYWGAAVHPLRQSQSCRAARHDILSDMTEVRILSIIPPMTQLNTPYPSTAYLTGFLRSRGFKAEQADLSIALALKLLSVQGVQAIHAQVSALPRKRHTVATGFFAEHFESYRTTIAPAIRFLQGRDPSLAHRIASRHYLPEGPRFASLEHYIDDQRQEGDALDWAFGALGLQDRAKHIATLYLNDLADVIRDAIDPRFEFVRYAESLAASQPAFDQLQTALSAPHNLVDASLHALTLEALSQYQPTLLLITAPFPGNVYGAFRIAQTTKQTQPSIVTVLGGGYCNTELRDMNEPRVFDYFDFITLDAGERPLLALIEHLQNKRPLNQLVRTYTRKHQYVDFREPDIAFSEIGKPTYAGLPLHDYLSLLDMLNPMHRLWSDGRWNKLTVAHGCYWKKCSFCDVNLDYISRYDVATTDVLIGRIESLVRETGQTGFHFVDEAAPPKALKSLANALLQRKLDISWWGNIRFEKSFDAGLCRLLAESGCIAVTGGLEVASDRLLKLMK